MDEVWLTIALAGALTYGLRSSFLVVADRLVDLPPVVERVLRQIPPAVFAAIVVPSLVRPEGTFDLWQPELAAGVVAGLVGWRTRNIALTLAVGMLVLAALQQTIGSV